MGKQLACCAASLCWQQQIFKEEDICFYFVLIVGETFYRKLASLKKDEGGHISNVQVIIQALWL